MIDQLESETNGVRTRAGMAENARQGYFSGSRPPFGFRVEKIATSARQKNKLVIEPTEAELVREVFRQYLAGSGAKATARYMNQRGLLYRKRLWTRDLVLRVVSDTGVVGTYNWGRSIHAATASDRRANGSRLRSSASWTKTYFAWSKSCGCVATPAGTLAACPPARSSSRGCSAARFAAIAASSKAPASSTRMANPIATTIAADSARRARKPARAIESRSKRSTAPSSAISPSTYSRRERCHEILREFVEDQGVLRQKTAEQRRLLERERDELGKRLERWYERIETDSELGDVGAERLRELKAKRDEVVRTLAKLKPMHSVPPYLYKPETIQRFQARLREAFLGGDRATARVYLQNLVDHIVVGEDEIIIEARAGAALAMMSAPGTSSPEAIKGEVLARRRLAPPARIELATLALGNPRPHSRRAAPETASAPSCAAGSRSPPS